VILVAAHAMYIPVDEWPDSLSALKKGFNGVIDGLLPCDRVSIWRYDAERVAKVSGWTDPRRGKIGLASVEGRYLGNGCAHDPRLYRAMHTVLSEAESKTKYRRRVMLMVSDGLDGDARRDEDYADEDILKAKRLERIAGKARKTETKLYIVGHSNWSTEPLEQLKQLAEMSDGLYIQAPDEEGGVQQALKRVAVEVAKDRAGSSPQARYET
jgi:hypothetical protein